jgi:4-hydroxyphenylpyruvate dioxygenase-like putative hemolysin
VLDAAAGTPGRAHLPRRARALARGDDAAARELGALLVQLGFARVGRHRSKAVTLYRQGPIQLVVNAEPVSPARARFDVQGPSVCALGLATPEPVQAASRAAALLSARHESPRGPGQLQLPAVVAPGGTIVHFVPSAGGAALDADFVAEPAAGVPAPDAGLETIDHIALGLAADQFDTWISSRAPCSAWSAAKVSSWPTRSASSALVMACLRCRPSARPCPEMY